MKTRHLLPIAALTVSATATAEVEQEIPWGVEAVTGFRSEYIYRGFKMANAVIDVQAEAEIAINDDLITSFGAWYATATGSGGFSEAAGYANIRWDIERFTLGFEATWKSLEHSIYQDGLDLSPTLAWHLNDELDSTGGLAWDTGADGLYVFTEIAWSKSITTNGFVSADAGLSWVNDYYLRSGLNDAYARVSYTQVLNRSVSITPFIGTSAPLQSDTETVRLFGGIWFEVNF